MVEKLIGALCKCMEEKWGEEYRVYTESVYQNAVKPCFFIDCENVKKMNLLGGRFFVRVGVKITLVSDSDERKYEFESMVGELFHMMNLIKRDENTFIGRQIEADWEDGKMVVRGVYDLFFKEEKEDSVLMESIEVVKGE